MRQGIDLRRVNGEMGVEQVRQPDAQSLRNQSEARAVGVETPRTSFPDLPNRVVVPIDEPVGNLARGLSGKSIDRVRAEPLRRNNGHVAVRADPAHDGADRHIFKAHAGRETVSSRPPADDHLVRLEP